MRSLIALVALAASAVQAAYPRDIVQYWVDQTTLIVNGTVIGGLQSPPSGWASAVVHGAIYLAAHESSKQSLAFQQLAVSHAAHNSLVWVFHGTRAYNAIDAAIRTVLGPIGINATSADGIAATKLGRGAAGKVALKRADDQIADFVDYSYGPRNVGVYQQTPGGNPLPDNPQAVHIRYFGGVKNTIRAPPPPPITDPKFEEYVLFVKNQGDLNSTVRTPYNTDTAYFWRESSIAGWNRFANAIIGNSLATKVVESAKFYAQLNYALANAGFASWDAKYRYNYWRPVTAIQRTDIWLPSKRNISAPNWTPLLRPTPSHPDYTSTHATFGGAAAAVLRAYNKGDKIDASFSSNVTLDNRGVITRRYTNLTEAAIENALSRIYGGIHFEFAGIEGIKLGDAVARETLKLFDNSWDEF